jgi:hypothetical protein
MDLYLVGSIGKINPYKWSFDELPTFPNYTITTITPPFKSIVGGYVGLGAGFGSKRFKYSTEFGLGRMPNQFTPIFKLDPYDSDAINGNTEKCFTSTYYLNFGWVYSF